MRDTLLNWRQDILQNLGGLPEPEVKNWEWLYLLKFTALQHSFFEAIHPFVDGNGRTGRILTNYLLVSQGFPIISVKGGDASRKSYYDALQEADAHYNDFFQDSPGYDKLTSILASSTTVKLEELFFRGLREYMDRLIVSLMEQKGEKMLNSEELAVSLGYSRNSIRKFVERRKLVSIERRGTYISHPSLLHKSI
jgi:Fic family protein